MAAIWIVEDDPKIGLLIEMTVRKTGHAAGCRTRWRLSAR